MNIHTDTLTHTHRPTATHEVHFLNIYIVYGIVLATHTRINKKQIHHTIKDVYNYDCNIIVKL